MFPSPFGVILFQIDTQIKQEYQRVSVPFRGYLISNIKLQLHEADLFKVSVPFRGYLISNC